MWSFATGIAQSQYLELLDFAEDGGPSPGMAKGARVEAKDLHGVYVQPTVDQSMQACHLCASRGASLNMMRVKHIRSSTA
jgi:hypothetical protein